MNMEAHQNPGPGFARTPQQRPDLKNGGRPCELVKVALAGGASITLSRRSLANG